MKAKQRDTIVGRVTIRPLETGGFRCLDSNGAGIATVNSYAEATKIANYHNAVLFLVEKAGKDEAIEMLRSGVYKA